MRPMRKGRRASSAYPMAAVTPESGTGTTRSAGTPDSRASWRPIRSRLSCTQRPKMRLSGRGKKTCAEEEVGLGEAGGVWGGAGEVDVLEDATGLREAGGVLAAGDAVFGDHDQFAGENVALVFGAEQVKGAGFGGKDDGVRPVEVADAAHGERAEAARIAGGEDAVAGHHDDGESALDLAERVGDGVNERRGAGVGDELDDDLGVGGGLEVCAVALEAGADVAEVDQVAVVGDGDEALGRVHPDG